MTKRSEEEDKKKQRRERERETNKWKKKKKNKNDYLYKRVCIIDNLIHVFFKIGYVKQKKIGYAKIYKKS